MEFEGLTLNNAQNIRRHLEKLTQTQGRDDHPWNWFYRFLHDCPEHRDWSLQAVREMLEDGLVDGHVRPENGVPDILHLAHTGKFYELRPLIETELALDAPKDTEWLLDNLLGLTNEYDAPLSPKVMDDVARHGKRKGLFKLALTVLASSDRDRAADFAIEEFPAALERREKKAVESLGEKLGLYLEQPERLRIIRTLAANEPKLRSKLGKAIEAGAEYMEEPEVEELLHLLEGK